MHTFGGMRNRTREQLVQLGGFAYLLIVYKDYLLGVYKDVLSICLVQLKFYCAHYFVINCLYQVLT